MKRLLYFPGLVLILCFSVSMTLHGQTTIQSSAVNEENVQLGNIMVIHLGENYDTRKTVEGEITYRLNKYKYNVSPSNRYFDHKRIPTQEQIKKVLQEHEFDGVLATIFTDIQAKERFENPQAAYNLTPTSPTFYNFLDSYQNKYSTGYTIQETAFVVHTRLFKADDETVIYQAFTETFQPQTLDMAVEDFSKSIAKELKKIKVLKKR